MNTLPSPLVCSASRPPDAVDVAGDQMAPKRSESLSAGSRLTSSPGLSRPRVVRSSVSWLRSAAKDVLVFRDARETGPLGADGVAHAELPSRAGRDDLDAGAHRAGVGFS